MRGKSKDYIITPAKVLSNTELESLKALCTRYLNIERERRNAALLLIALECGLRATEVLSITFGDIDFDSNTILIRSLKGSNARVLPVRPSLLKVLKTIALEKFDTLDIKQVKKDQKVFNISYSRLEQVWRMMRPNPSKTLHSLRHTFAVVTFLRTKDIKLVQNALGHRSINNTLVYVDFVYANETMRKGMVVGD